MAGNVVRRLRRVGPGAGWLAGLCVLPVAAQQAPPAPDLAAGQARAESVCAACHGANGLSVADNIPNLAGQRRAYLEAQLRALKAGTRKAPSMNAIAAQLGNEDIVNVAAFFAGLPAAGGAAKSSFLPALATSRATLPASYPAGFAMYQTVNRPDLNQVRYLYANEVALKAAREGRPMPDGALLVLEQHAARLDADRKPVTRADGFYEPDRLLGYTVMEHGAGWGREVPEMLRNADWNYAAYTAQKVARTGVHQADCMACHKPLAAQSYLFSIEPLKRFAMAR